MPVVLSDAVAGTTTVRHHAALACIEQACGFFGTLAEVGPAFGLQAAVPVSW